MERGEGERAGVGLIAVEVNLRRLREFVRATLGAARCGAGGAALGWGGGSQVFESGHDELFVLVWGVREGVVVD